MKNLPDDEPFNSLENRLRNYSELPEEGVWHKIAGSLPASREPAWIVWANRAAVVFSFAALFFLIYNERGADVSLMELTDKNRHRKSTEVSPEILLNDLNAIENSIKMNDLSETAKLQEFIRRSHQGHSQSSVSVVEDPQDDKLVSFSSLSNSPVAGPEELRHKQKALADTDTVQVITKMKADSVPAVIQKQTTKKRRKKSGI